jgi:hypothetical protein
VLLCFERARARARARGRAREEKRREEKIREEKERRGEERRGEEMIACFQYSLGIVSIICAAGTQLTKKKILILCVNKMSSSEEEFVRGRCP